MYYCDKHGRLWLKDGDIFRNVGVSVAEKQVVFNTITAVQIIPGSVEAHFVEDPVPVTLREAIKRLGVTESRPLRPIEDVS